MAKLKSLTKNKTRLEMLKKLAEILADKLEQTSDKNISTMAKQYRETLAEIEAIEKTEEADDEIGKILSKRKFEGKSDAVRKSFS